MEHEMNPLLPRPNSAFVFPAMPDDIEFEMILGKRREENQPPHEDLPIMFGKPEEETKNWRPRQFDASGLLSCISMCLYPSDRFRGHEHTLQDKARKLGHGACLSRQNILDLIDEREFIRYWDNTVTGRDLPDMLEFGEKVICGVNGLALAFPRAAEIPGLGVNQYVQIIGCEMLGDAILRVIVNDPCVEKETGAGKSIDYSIFEKVWLSTLVIRGRWDA